MMIVCQANINMEATFEVAGVPMNRRTDEIRPHAGMNDGRTMKQRQLPAAAHQQELCRLNTDRCSHLINVYLQSET